MVAIADPHHLYGRRQSVPVDLTAVSEGIVQGERDPFGGRSEVDGYGLAPSIEVVWISDGDHDLGPRGGSGFTRPGNLAAAADAVAAFAGRLGA